MRHAFFVFMIFCIPISLVASELPTDCPKRPEDAEAAAAEAGTWFQIGIEHAAAEAFEAAGSAFLCSDRLVPHPATLLNIANAAEHAGDSAGAEAAYAEFIRRYPEDSRAAAAAAALKAIRSVSEEAVQENDGKAAPSPNATAGDSGADEAPAAAEKPAMGPTEGKMSSTKEREAGKAEEPQSGRKVRGMRAAGFSLLAVGAATMVTGVVTGAVALSYDRELDEACIGGQCGEAQWDKLDAMQGLGTATTALLAVGGTVAVIGAVLPIAAKRVERKTKPAVSASVTPFAGGRSFGIGIQGAF